MVHNGVEYAEMQLIAEAHDIMSEVWAYPMQSNRIFQRASKGPLQGFW